MVNTFKASWKNIGQTGKKLLEKLCNKLVAYVFAANLYEPPYETIDPYPQGHQLIVTQGQTHYRQSVQFAFRPEAANKKSSHFNQYTWFTKSINQSHAEFRHEEANDWDTRKLPFHPYSYP
jgi:hypothetical protein